MSKALFVIFLFIWVLGAGAAREELKARGDSAANWHAVFWPAAVAIMAVRQTYRDPACGLDGGHQ